MAVEAGDAEVMRTHWMSPPKLPRYGGEPADGPVEDFIDEADRLLKAYTMKDALAVEWIIRHLDGHARKEVLNKPADARTKPKEVLDILLKAFGDARRLPDLTKAFTNRAQGAGESILAYSHAMVALLTLILSRSPDEIKPASARDRFVDGLRNATLRRHLRDTIRRTPATTLEETRDEAIRWMREEEPEEVVVRQQTANTEEIQALKDNVTALTTAVQALMEERRSEPRTSRSIRCYNCNKPGHIMRHCPTQRKGSQSAGNGRLLL